MVRSLFPVYIWVRVRPWMHRASAPAASSPRANATAFLQFSRMPERNFTVMGRSTAFFIAETMAQASAGSPIRALPSPLEKTFGTGQPMLTSMKSGWHSSTVLRAASAITSGSWPKS